MKAIPLLLAALSGLTFAAGPSALPAGKPQQLTSPDQVPEGLAKSDWHSIRAAYEAGRHAFHAVDGGWQARNPGQQWTTHFDGRGFLAKPKDADWQWGLEFKSYGFGDHQTQVSGTPAARADGQRLTYQWNDTVQEWFVNDQRGLEHGFIITERPATDESSSSTASPLSFTLATRGSLRPSLSADAQTVHFRDASNAPVLNYSGLKVWDADGKILSSRFEADGENQFRFMVEEVGARYPLTIDPIAQQAYFKASNTGALDRFGISIAISGDTAVVGAYAEDSSTTGINSTPNESATDAGAAYVFVRNGTTWTQQAYLKASNHGSGGTFGGSVSVSGDTVVVGARTEDSSTTGVNSTPNQSASNSGAAYVFVRSGTTWSQQAYLKASNTAASDSFGVSVAVSGDTVVVGATGEDSSSTGVNSTPNESAALSGAAYVFMRSGTTWSQQAYLKASQVTTGDAFGISVAVSENTVIVGAQGEDSSTTGINSTPNEAAGDAGAAYVFTRSGTTWSQQAYLKPAAVGSTQVNDRFGISVALSGDTAVVGAWFEDSSTTGANSTPNESIGASGAAYVFTRSGTTWSQQAYLKPSSTTVSDNFGYSTAVSGDTAVIGSPAEDSSSTGVNSTPNESADASGAAYVFVRSGTSWSQQAYLKASNTGVSDNFSQSVAVSGDTVFVGAPEEDSSTTGVNSTPNELASASGAAYIFTGLGPVIAVEQPAGSGLSDGFSNIDFGLVALGSNVTKTFTVKNTGITNLTLGAITTDGTNPGDFSLNTAGMLTTVIPGGSTTFTATFSPTGGTTRSAAIHIANNETGARSLFDITLTGIVLPPPPVVSSGTTASGVVGIAFAGYTITASNSPTSYSASGLPTGLSINTASGVISGTPAQSGTFSVTLGATNAGGTGNATLALVINVPATITPSASALNLPASTYGTASSPQQCGVTGDNLTAGITATAPVGMEVSSDGNTYASTALLPPSGGTLRVRFSAAAAAGSYNAQNVVLSSSGAANVNLAVSGTVSPKPLTITGPTVTKVYDGTTAGGMVTLGTLTGFVGTQTVTATATATAYAGSNAGSAYSSTVSYVLADGANGGKAANYSLASSVISNAAITKKSLTITAPTVTKVYDGTTVGGVVTVGSISGLVGSETLVVTGTATPYGNANVGSSYATIVSYTLADGANGGKATNYTMANSAIVNASITKKALTVTASNVTKYSGVTLNPVMGSTAFTSSGLVSPQTIGSVTITYGTGAVGSAAAGTYAGQVMPSAASGGTFATGNYNLTYAAGNLTVLATTQTASYSTGAEVPITSNGYTATGKTISFTLNYVPAVGTELMVVKNTGLDFISGTFDNLVQGQTVKLTYGGITYTFVVNYFGGSGNDMVLAWANTRTMTWGANYNGELGDAVVSNRSVPGRMTGALVNALNGKIVTAVSAGSNHSVALCSDGTVAAWGYNYYGQLGNNSTTNSSIPVAVNRGTASALNGKMVIALAAGHYHNVALCSDGTMAAWGYNYDGQLGNGSTAYSSIPVAVNMGAGSALSGKTVIAIAAGYGHSVALCSDGTVAAWGRNSEGQLGNSSTTISPIPVAVIRGSGALNGKTVAAIAAGAYHSVALCADGTVAAWGYNVNGQLGNSSTTNTSIPVAVNHATGSALNGKTVTAVSAGSLHSLALCSDGTVASWGSNEQGCLGINNNGTTTYYSSYSGYGSYYSYYYTIWGSSNIPVAVTTSAGTALHGKTVTAVAAGNYHSVALCSDGTMAAWGSGTSGQLGNNTFSSRSVPVAVSRSTLGAADRFLLGTRTGGSGHSLSMVALPGYTVTAITGANGFISPAGTTEVKNDSSQTYTITPDAGYHVADVLVDGVSVGPVTSHVFDNLSADRTISAIFAISQPPTDITLSATSVAEGRPAGTTVGTLSSPNVPAGTGTFTLVSGTGSADNSSFSIAGNSLKTASVFNYATKASYSIRVRVTDDYGATFEKAFTISAIDSVVVATGGQITVTSGTELGGAPLVVNGGTLSAGGSSTLAVTNAVSLSGSSTIQGNAVTLSGPVSLANNTSLNVSSSTVTVNGSLNAATAGGTFTKTGSGTLVLNGDISSIGSITIIEGTIVVNGSSGTTVYTVGNAATLQGSGSVGAIILQPGSTISPGNSPGTMMAETTTWSGGSNYDWEINDASGNIGSNPGWDVLQITGALTITATPADKFNFKLLTLDLADVPGEMVNFNNAQSYVWTVVTTTGGITGFDPADINLNTSAFQNSTGGGALSLAVVGGTDLVLIFTSDKPETTITSGPPAVTNNPSAEIAFTGTDNVEITGFLGSLDGAEFAPVTSPVNLTSLPDGIHTYEVRAIDADGNLDATPASMTWTVDSTPPTLLLPADITVVSTGPVGAVVNYFASASDPGGSGVAISSFTPGSGSVFPIGTTTVNASATDNAGYTVTGSFTITVTNAAPTFAGYIAATPYQTAATISLGKILTKAADANGDTLSVTAAGPSSTNGGTAVLQASSILYTPANGFSGTDTFPVTITDALGAIVVGTVTVNVQINTGIGTNAPVLTTMSGGRMGIGFQGIPGRSYEVQRSTNMSDWTPLTTVTAAANGAVTFIDESPPPGSGFYRLRKP